MVPFTSPGPACGGPPGPPGPPGPGPWAESEPAARRRPSAAERVDRMSELSGRLWMQTKLEDRVVQSLQHGHYDQASERFQTAQRPKWFAAGAVSHSYGRSCARAAVGMPNA